jgi:hypothetical protein
MKKLNKFFILKAIFTIFVVVFSIHSVLFAKTFDISVLDFWLTVLCSLAIFSIARFEKEQDDDENFL